jgi:hypothetical protein
MIRSALFFYLFCCCSLNSLHAQYNLDREPDAYQGIVTLNNKLQWKGLIRFYDHDRLAAIEKNGESSFLAPSDVAEFEFFDKLKDKTRKFVTMEYRQYDTSIPKVCFLEILKEYKDVALLLKSDRVMSQPAQKQLLGSYPSRSPLVVRDRNVTARQTETVILMDSEGKIFPYYELLSADVQGSFFDFRSNDAIMINKNLLRKLTGRYYKQLVWFAKENDLTVTNPLMLIQILDKYEELSANRVN